MLATSYSETYINMELITIAGIVFIVLLIPTIFLLRKKNYETKYIEGKLIRKVKDDRNEERNIQNIAGTKAFGPLHRWRQEGETTRYYITFETEKGIKSFTVSEKTYRAIKKNQTGIIGMKGKKFVSFKRT